jgi:hypothetical protein
MSGGNDEQEDRSHTTPTRARTQAQEGQGETERAMPEVIQLAPYQAERRRREAEAEIEAELRQFVEDDRPLADARSFRNAWLRLVRSQ